MAISIQRYINIVSGVGGAVTVPQRQLITRIFTTNSLLPTESYLEFTSAAQVGAYFGLASQEYLRAVFYFSWVSPNITSPQKISYARWASAATASQIFGIQATYSLSNFTSVTNADFTLNMGGFSHHLTGISFSGAASLSAVATDIQTAVNAYSAGGAAWTAATVTYDSTNNRFDLTSGLTGTDVISVLPGATTDLLALVGWGAGAIFSNGSAAETLTQTLTNSDSYSDNFGSFLFIGNESFTSAQQVEIATWNTAQNVKYMYLTQISTANASAFSAALIGYSGVSMNLEGISTEYHDMPAGIIMAATDYTKRISSVNYMFKQFNLTPTVTTDANANTYDALLINYYGVTQTAGKQLAFYQRGILTGNQSTQILDQNTYANEQWLKSAFTASLANLLISLGEVSANLQGSGQIQAVQQSVINQALFNNVISVGKILNANQQVYITTLTGDANAWRQVQNIGYWYQVVFSTYTAPDGRLEYKAVYTLIYSKNDTVRQITGTDILI